MKTIENIFFTVSEKKLTDEVPEGFESVYKEENFDSSKYFQLQSF